MAKLVPEVGEALAEMGFIGAATDVAFARLRKVDFAYVLFDHEYYGALEVIRPYLDSLGIVSAGRYGGWNYSSMEDALIFGRDAATKARRWLS
jgi:protoporphyrinogen oxidase